MLVPFEKMRFYIWDLETYINCFLFSGKFLGAKEVYTFELSPFSNEKDQLLSHLSYLQNSPDIFMVGFNSLGFDYPIIHDLLNGVHTFDYMEAFNKAQQIINTQDYGFTGINLSERKMHQIDLAKINHFDNKNKRTSLKALQFAMRSETVEDLPFDYRKPLTAEQIVKLKSYNVHDIVKTEMFLEKNLGAIKMRMDLLQEGVLKGDVLNYSDVKIGEQYLINKIGRAKCFHGNKPRQTHRESVAFNEIILPKIEFRTEPFTNVLNWFKSQTHYIAAEKRPALEASLGGLTFFFGIGGLHASVESKIFESNEEYVIKDVDVAGMYPAISIANKFAPEHLGEAFITAFAQLYVDRKQYAKGTSRNKVLKLAANGATGKGDDIYSCFYDPKFPLQIKINGQLQILQLAELISLIPGVKLIQANTDGITSYVPRKLEHLFNFWCSEWEKMTGLQLEYVDYKKMWIRDCNNYLAEYL